MMVTLEEFLRTYAKPPEENDAGVTVVVLETEPDIVIQLPIVDKSKPEGHSVSRYIVKGNALHLVI